MKLVKVTNIITILCIVYFLHNVFVECFTSYWMTMCINHILVIYIYVTWSLVLCVCFVDRCLSFVLFLLVIVLSGIFKLFLIVIFYYAFSDYNKIRRNILYFLFSEYSNLSLSYLSFVQPFEIPVKWSVNYMGVHEWICHPIWPFRWSKAFSINDGHIMFIFNPQTNKVAIVNLVDCITNQNIKT